jgi:hypothetical protein
MEMDEVGKTCGISKCTEQGFCVGVH